MSESPAISIGYTKRALDAFSAKFLDIKTCQEWFIKLTFPDGISCPSCGNKITDDITFKNFSSFNRCTCKNCNHWFTTTSGTILQGSHFTAREFYLLCLLLALKVDAKEIGRILKTHPDTIKFWQKKINLFIDKTN